MSKKDSFIVYRSFYIGLTALKNRDRLQLYDAIFEYGLNTKEIELKPLPKAMFHMIKPQLEANHRKFINGSKGGRPVNPNSQRQQDKVTKQEPNHNLDITKAEPNVNDNVNDNVNVNDNGNVGFPLKDGKLVFLDVKFIKELIKTYPHVDIHKEMLKMRIWLVANPKERKTSRGTPRFVNNWLSRIKPSSPTDSYANMHQAVLDSKNVRR